MDMDGKIQPILHAAFAREMPVPPGLLARHPDHAVVQHHPHPVLPELRVQVGNRRVSRRLGVGHPATLDIRLVRKGQSDWTDDGNLV